MKIGVSFENENKVSLYDYNGVSRKDEIFDDLSKIHIMPDQSIPIIKISIDNIKISDFDFLSFKVFGNIIYDVINRFFSSYHYDFAYTFDENDKIDINLFPSNHTRFYDNSFETELYLSAYKKEIELKMQEMLNDKKTIETNYFVFRFRELNKYWEINQFVKKSNFLVIHENFISDLEARETLEKLINKKTDHFPILNNIKIKIECLKDTTLKQQKSTKEYFSIKEKYGRGTRDLKRRKITGYSR